MPVLVNAFVAHIAENYTIIYTAQKRMRGIANVSSLIRDDMMCMIEEVGEVLTTVCAKAPLPDECFSFCYITEIKWSRHNLPGLLMSSASFLQDDLT